MQLWAALTLHSLILIVILRILWWHYDRKMPGVNNASIVECGFKTIQYYVMLCAAYLGNGYAQMPHNRQFVTKGKSFMVFLHFGEKSFYATWPLHFIFYFTLRILYRNSKDEFTVPRLCENAHNLRFSVLKNGKERQFHGTLTLWTHSYLYHIIRKIIDQWMLYKVILFSSSMVGVVIWMSYRASLASRLAITEYRS